MYVDNIDNEYEAVSLLVNGSVEGFNFLYRKYSHQIYMNIFKYVKNVNIAEDLLQDVFLALWEHRTSINGECAVGGWLFKVSYNKSIAVLKRQLKAQMLQEQSALWNERQEEPGGTAEMDYQYKVSLLKEAVDCLPATKQQVYRLNKFEHKKPEEISEELGLTVISVKHYLKQSNKLVKQYVRLKYPLYIVLMLWVILTELGCFCVLR